MDAKGLAYDPTDPKSILKYAKLLIGHTFQEVSDGTIGTAIKDASEEDSYSNRERKGGLGNLLEEKFFGYKANNEQRADFEEAGIEVKSSPYQIIRGGQKRAGERLVLTDINYNGPVELTLEQSHMWQKSKLLLLIYYYRDRHLVSNLLYRIDYVSLFTPDDTDLEIIKSDYKVIVAKVRAGKAQELSEADTFYLGACTKGANAKKSIVLQWYPPHNPAKKRAFCYKVSYMTYVLNEYVIGGRNAYEKILSPGALGGTTFKQLILDRINCYKGKTDEELCSMFDRVFNNNKSMWVDLGFRMLGIRSNRAEEFAKANIIVKACRINPSIDGGQKLAEEISFPTFRFMQLINEKWEDSALRSYFEETTHLYIVYKLNDSGSYTLTGAQLWNLPMVDIEGQLKRDWEASVKAIRNGLKFTPEFQKGRIVVHSTLPSTDDSIAFIKPHSSKTYYEYRDGDELVVITKSQMYRRKSNGIIELTQYNDLYKEWETGITAEIDEEYKPYANMLPNGDYMTTSGFWINRDYILAHLNAELR